MNDINIEKYRDLENISVSEFLKAIANVETKVMKTYEKEDKEGYSTYHEIYLELQLLLGKKINEGIGLGYKPRTRTKI